VCFMSTTRHQGSGYFSPERLDVEFRCKHSAHGGARDTPMKAYFVRLIHHADWANVRVLDALRLAPPHNPRALQLLAHVLSAEHIYHERMTHKDPWPQDFWPDLSLEQCGALVNDNRLQYRGFIAALPESDLDRLIRYRNSQGMVFHTPLKELLMHVALHGAYHRGQIAQVIRQGGGEPVNTDFITFVREIP
jgi:uncharacterized damage-inducible protein DinB